MSTLIGKAAPPGSTIGIVGHGATLSTLPLGVQATVNADALTLTIDEPALAT